MCEFSDEEIRKKNIDKSIQLRLWGIPLTTAEKLMKMAECENMEK